MSPIVNGLEGAFRTEMSFVYLNAADSGQGQQAFESLNLPGHPSYVIFSAAGRETHRTFGVVEADQLRTAIQDNL